jgi:hypothetical protein
VHVGIDGLLVEMVRNGRPAGAHPDDETETTSLDVWHDTWMFGIEVEPEAHVEVTWDAEYRDYDPPEAPSRAGQVRVHGTWQPAGQTAWAPYGYPGVTPEQR